MKYKQINILNFVSNFAKKRKRKREREREMINSVQKLNDLIWSPTRNDEFVAFGNDIFLFKFDQNKSTISRICLNTSFFLLVKVKFL